MRSTKYDKSVLEELLLNQKKNVSQIYKAINQKRKENNEKIIAYSGIYRSIQRLKKEGLIDTVDVETKKGPLGEKQCWILVSGLVELYFKDRDEYFKKCKVEKKEKNLLEFHCSGIAPRIVDRIIKDYFRYHDLVDDKRPLYKTLFISPASMDFFKTFYKSSEPKTIRDSDLFKKIALELKFARFLFDLSPEHISHANFLNLDLPLKLLAEDFYRYPEDKEIKRFFSKLLLTKYKNIGKITQKQNEDLFDKIIKSIANGTINLKESNSYNWKKFQEQITEEEKNSIECLKHWYIYLPPSGEPRLKCDGKCPFENSSVQD